MRPIPIHQILSRQEMWETISDLQRNRRGNDQQNLIIFRLSACCGLRVSEIGHLECRDFAFSAKLPTIHIRAGICKTKVGRHVPLWWDSSTRDDLQQWVAYQESRGRKFLLDNRDGRPFAECAGGRQLLYSRWKTAIRTLGVDRIKQLSIHCGRKSFITHALAVGSHQRGLREVMQAVGHSSLSVTSRYLGLLDAERATELFGRDRLLGESVTQPIRISEAG